MREPCRGATRQNPISVLGHVVVDSLRGRKADWPAETVFDLLPRRPIRVRGYVDLAVGTEVSIVFLSEPNFEK